MTFVSLNKIERGPFNEDTGTDSEITKPAMINVASIRCYYPRRDNKAGARITFNDGGGFAVAESVEDVSALVGAPLEGDAIPA